MTKRRIVDKITSYFGVKQLSDITWASRVNTRADLEKRTASPGIMMLEGDVLYVPKAGGVVMVHKFDRKIDLSFEEWLRTILKVGKGAKVDLKQLRSVGEPPVEQCLGMLAEIWDPEVPLVLNADIFVGPGGDRSVHDPVDPQWFFQLCNEYCSRRNPNALLSLGWVISGCSDKVGYTREMIDQILNVVGGPGLSGLGGFTFPIKGCYIKDSWEQIRRLLDNPQHTLTIWSHDDPITEELKAWLRKETDPERTFYDLTEPKDFTPIKIWGELVISHESGGTPTK